MKRVFLFLILFISVLSFTTKVSADYTCNYKSDNGETASFTAQNDPPTLSFAIKGESSMQSEEILNWNDDTTAYGITGYGYYVGQLCPEYVVVSNQKSTLLDVCFDCRKAFVAGTENEKTRLVNRLKLDIKQQDGWPKVYKLTKQREKEKEEPEDIPSSCLDFDETNCMTNNYFSCLWVNKGIGKPYCNTDALLYVKCGNSYDIPVNAPKVISYIINLFKIATPIILIIVSIINFVKALASSKEDEIKKAQSGFVKKMIAAVLAFLVILIVQFVIKRVAEDSDIDHISSCLNCFLNNDCSGSMYYKTDVGGTTVCHDLYGNEVTCNNKN